jgi:hypothetical protein
MWLLLCLVAVAVPRPPSAVPLAAGTYVRLSAAPRPRSGDRGRPRYAVPVRREGPLLVFTYADGSTSASLLPGASVTGTFEGADASWVHLRRAADRPPIRLHRGSVARVEVTDGRQYPVGKRMAQGLGVGLVVGAGLMGASFLNSGGGGGEEGAWAGGMALLGIGFSGAVGAGLGMMVGVGGGNRWREVPLDALGTPPTAVRAEDEPTQKQPDALEKGYEPGG